VEILGQLKNEYIEPEILVSEKLKKFIDDNKEIDIEIGFGKGSFIINKALMYKNINFIGYEIKKKFVDYVEKIIKNKNISNVYVEKNYAEKAIPKQIPDYRVRNIYINFPDPWWKSRHKKRRILQKKLIDVFYNSLKINGRIYIRTDVEEYAKNIDNIFKLDERFKNIEHDIVNDGIFSDREKKYKDIGIPIYYKAFEKIK
jgi:tRNA (guanine-N7-)-methyltransferase